MDKAKQKKTDKKLAAAERFVQKIGGIEKAKQALEELRKLQKAA
jgi:hypothetical protein